MHSIVVLTLTSRLALCETDHASDTGDNRGCVFCASDGAEILREWAAMIAPSVIATNLLIRCRNLGRAGNKGIRQPVYPTHTKEQILETIPVGAFPKRERQRAS